MKKDKVVGFKEALEKIQNGQTLMLGGFTNTGSANTFIPAIVEAGYGDFNIISNDAGNDSSDGIGTLVCRRRIKGITASHIGLNPEVARQMNSGEINVTLIPQGTLAERIRCGGFGLGGFLTPTGVGTVVQDGKELLKRDGRTYILELPLRADVAILKAWKADRSGNLVYRRCARNFNPIMAMAADFVIVEAETVVETGEIDPDEVMTPGICVDMIVRSREN